MEKLVITVKNIPPTYFTWVSFDILVINKKWEVHLRINSKTLNDSLHRTLFKNIMTTNMKHGKRLTFSMRQIMPKPTEFTCGTRKTGN